MEVLYENYNALVSDPIEPLHEIDAYLGGGLNVEMMAKTVDKKLYRKRK